MGVSGKEWKGMELKIFDKKVNFMERRLLLEFLMENITIEVNEDLE